MRKKMVVAAGVSLALLCTAVVFGQLLDVEVRDQSPGVVSSASANSPEWVPSRGVMGSGHPETGGAFVRNGDAEVLYSQPPNQVYAFFSAPNCFSYYGQCGSGQQSVADNFVLADRKVLEMVRFWGGCFSSPGTDQVTINLYVDSGGTPGSLVYGETGTAVTGELTGASAIGLAEVRYEATLGSTVTLEPGVSYWIEICNYNTGVWGWETGSGPGDNGLVAAETPGVNWGPLSPSSDMAFELVGSNPELLEDCNSNGIEDSTDIAMGTSLDCQPNGIPDECEVDCNENGTPDDCDIDAGTSDDINENGVPDECDAGPVDLFTWTEMDYESGGAGDWQVAADGLSVVQTINANPTFYISDFDLINSDFSGRLRVEESGGDDDFIGFVFGFTDLSGAPFYLLDWKQNSQSTNWGYAEEGLKLRKITGIPSLNELWDGEPDTHQQILAEHLSSSYGWDDGTEYEYNLTYQSDGRIHIVVRNASTWAVIWDVEYIDPDPIGVGKVGFYNFSQSLVRYSGFSQAVLLPPVAVPGGPYSFAAATSQITLDAMGSTDPDGDNGDFSDIASVQWDLGNDGIADDVGRVNALQPLDRADALAKGLAIGSPIDLGLTVVDHDNLTDHEVTQIVYENTSPTVDAGGPYESIASGETVVLDGSVDDADLAVEVGFDELTVEWDVVPATDAAEIGDGFANAANTEVSFETLLARLGGLGVHTIYLNVCDAAGAVASASAQITLSPPDLELTGCSGPAEIAAGDSIEVSWTVTNLGPSEAPGSWVDRVYLSDDAVVGEDIELGEFAHSGPLAGGALYDLTETVVIPGGLSGPHWITVVTDAGATVDELGAEANNGDVCGGVMVYQPPAITAHPVGAMVCSGDSHQMCVSVTGTEPLTYQWHLSGVNIESAESDCYTATETGKYSCTVTNFADSVTSDEATVTIVDPADDCNSNCIDDACDVACGFAGEFCDVVGCGQSEDCNGSNVPDECELMDNDCNTNGIPDECELEGNDCNANSIPDDCELEGNDCNVNGTPDECELAGNDCNNNSIPDDCELEGNDCNGNGVPDECELEGNDCNGNSIPDDCELEGNDCNGNSVPDECELEGNDCNANGIPDDCELAGNDCNANGTPDDCEMGAPVSHNCCETGHGAGCNDPTIEACVCEGDEYCCTGEWDSDCVEEVELFECGSCIVENDCNGNGTLDECDIAGSTSTDCNANAVPDDCDIAGGTSVDCNENSMPDACDIAGGTSNDCDGNSIPDDCEVSAVVGIRISQESSPGADDFADNVLGFIEPYETTLTAAGYFRYDLGNQSSFNGPAPVLTNERSHLFLVNATDGLSLFVVHDAVNDSNGGSADTRYEVFGDPDGLVRTVEDDPGEGYTGGAGATVFTCDHAWSTCCTDGVVLTGLDGIWSLIMEFTSITGMNSWVVYSGDSSTIALALQQNRRIRIELVFEPSPADCNANGIPDACDLAAGTSPDCNGNSLPDECEVPPMGTGPDCNVDGVPDECQLADNDCNSNSIPDDCELEGNDCNGNGVPDECEPDCNSNGVADECDITGDTSTDCNENDIPDDCDITAGTSADCNNNNMPDECELATNDCNNNGFPDDCDVAAGTSPDCNSSGVPDECELADNDCNENGIPDECDIAAGTSEDCQPNGIPDECDLVTGKVWDRSEDWVPGTTHGSTAGNPANDSYGNPVWSYEWAQGGALGSGTPWYAQPPTLLVWDDDWFEHGVGCWARADNACPPISGGLTQCLSSSAWNYVPLVRWANPMGDGFQLDIEGVLTVMWSGQNGVGSPCDVDVVIAHADVSAGTTIPLYAVTASKPTPGDSVGDTVDLPVQLDDVVVDAGDSIVFTFRTRVSIQNRWNYLDDNVILRERGGAGDCNENGIPDDCDVAAGTSPDCNGSGVPDECELEGNDCNSSGVPDECELEGNDCNENGIPDECDVAVLDCNGNSIPDDCELEGNDCNENGIPDDCDVAVLDCNNSGIPDDCELEGNDCNGNGIPDECDPDCNSNGFPDDCDLTAGTSPDCNGNNVPDECDIAGGTSLDRNGNGIPDECEADCNNNGVPDDWDIAAGTSEDCNSSGIPDECELAGNDCNDNGVPDECDLAGGTSSDCNSNSIPDECDIAGDTAPDCNGNAVPDECDVAAGTSADCQPDGVPDECQLGGVVHFTDFESGAGGEWSSSATDNSVPNPFTRFSGRFDNSTQTLTLDVVAGLTYELTFDLMIIDSWDGNGPGGGNADWFNVHIDGVRVFHETFSNFDFGNQTYPHAPDVGPAGYGWGGGWPESIYRGVTLSFVPGGSTVQISFSGQDLQEISDESWGIDNVRVASGFGGDCNGNGIPDECDVAAGTSPDCNSTGIPDECELEGNDCNSSGVPDECELEGNDCNNNGIPDECDVAQQDCNNSGVPDDCELEGNDCNANGIPDECDVAQQDCNNSGVPDDCELEGNDCNNNGIPDECDISGETSKDCNENSVPDECDIAAGTAEDCNNNGTPDNCDISAGSSADCNSNGVPDECDMVWSTPLGEGLVLWLSADAVSGVGEGQPVSIWSDQSESSLDVAQSTPSAQPVYTGNVLNGLPALRFDGNDSFTRGSVLGSALTGTDQATIFLVEKQDGSDPHNSTLGWGTSTNRLLLHTTWEDRLHFQHGNANPGGNGSYSVPQPAGWDDAFHVVEFFRNATLAEILVDGNLLGAGTITDTPEINEQHPLYIGTDFFGNTFTGDICEILIYNRALSGLDRLKVSNYLNYKYGIFESGGGPTGDCNLNGVLDECDIAAGTSADCNSNGIPDECETDCNTNGIPDDCDIAAGTSPDCNTSGVPDECELQGNDCNSNAVPDECDIAGATSADHNSNGVPDECEGPPTVIEQVPDGVIHQPISFVDVTFSDQIDGSTFGAEDVELVGPAGDIPVDPPVREDGNRWRISFAEQSDEGFHDLVIGPDVISLAGHGMTEAYAGEFCLVMSEMAFQVIDLDPVVTTVAPLMSAEVTFSRTIDAATFTVDDAVLVAPSGPVLIDSVTLLATNVFELTWAPQSEEGNYVLRIGPDIADVCAGLMDQDMDGTAGEVPDDVFEGTIMLNTSPPQIVSHNPAGVVNVPFGFLEVTFDEIIDPASFTMSDVELSGPGGSVAINSVLAQSGTVYRITFPSQTANGDYTFTIGPDILDQAGSSMTVAYQPTIAVALPDLAVTQIINPSAAGTGQTISVNWTVTNVGPFDAFGAWVDRVYLSDDAEVGGDVLLGSFSQSGPVVSGGDYVRIEMVTLPHDVLGAYWIVVVTDANNAVPESGTPDNNSAVGGESLLISDATDPETAITSGPGDGTSVNTTEVTFGWSGSDNATPTGQLEYSYCLAPVATGCDPAGGPFSASTTDSFGDLTEADSPYIFKVVARDEAGNVDPTPAQRSFSVDLTPLTVLSHSPNGVVNDAVCAVEVTFSEPANGFGAGDVTLTGPSGAIAVTTVVGAGSAEVFEFRFACQSQDGVYNFSVGPNIFDPAGNPMAEPYTGSFSIALPDLTPISLDVPSNGVSSGQIEVNWAVLNQGASSVTSAWKDAVYLSDDSAWGDDTLLGEFGFSGTLEVASTYNRTQNVTLPIMFEGTYWIIIVVDSRGNVPEQQEGADNRLVSAQSLEIVLPPYPDLQVGEMTGPPSAWPGQQVTLCWTVTNSGDESTGAVLWKDTVYFSTDQVIDLPFTNMWGIYDPGDAVLGSFDNQSSLGSGESYQQCRSVTIPSDVVGCYYFLARTDSLNQVFEYQPGLDAEANNDGGIESCCDVEMMPPPDLRVTMVNAPASGWSGQAFTLTWEVTNAGQSATPVHYWQDSVYLSLDETLDSSDTRIYTIPEGYPGDYMPPGHSYTRTYTYPLPRWIDGDYYVFVLTDSANHVNEQGWEGNNDWHDSTPMTINLTPPPDLEISYLSVSESALAGSSVVVDWMVTNYGGSTTYGHSQNPTVVHRWTDAIYLSADDSFETTGNNVLLGRIESDYFESGLAPDESYSQSRSVTLPTCIDGPYYLFVVTDVDDKVEEYFAAYEANNDDVFEAMFVSTEAPDLQISNVAGPGVGSSGQQVTVSWEVANIGIGATGSGSFVDRVYLSADQALDTFEDMLLGSFTHADVVEPVDGYTETREVTLPPGMSGSYFIFALTNAAGDVDECGATGNNADYDAAGIFIAFTEADLMVSNVTVPSLGLSGQPISVDWTVVNAGNRATDATFWSDAVYLSSDGTLNTDHDTLLGTFAHTGALDSAESYDRSGSVTLPVGISGTYYVFVCADENDNVLEPEQENNNCTAAVPMSVVSTEPDLMVTTVTGPISGSSGDPILVEWTVENSGERATDQSSWRDAIYLSTDTELNKQNDVLLGSLTHSGALGAGEGYTASRTVTLSAGGTGSHYILVETDNAEVVYEAGREENNVGYDPAGIEVSCIEADLIVTDVSGPAMGDAGWPIQVGWTVSNVGDRATSTSSWIDAVYLSDDPDFNAGDTLLGEFSRNTVLGVGGLYTRTAQVSLPGGVSGVHYLFVVTDVEDDVEECADEGNNASTSPSAITIAATEVDLQVLSVNGPEQAYAGQDVTVNWSVINAGASTTPSGSWRDSVYLSLDLFVDPGSDPFLGFVVHENPLGSQVTYNRNKTFTIPASTLSDDYYVLVLADSTDEVFEYEAEGNNLGYSEDTIAVGEPLQADLVVTDIVVPLTASPGQQATFVWTVTNQGANAALGSWYDSVYLSVDETWDLGDALVAKVKHTGTVAADGGSYTASKTALVPGVVPVPQYVIVRCDINGQIPEGEEGEDNNIGMSTDTVDIQIIELELGVSFDSQLASSGMSHYYQVTVPAEETLKVTLDADALTGANELYIRYGQIPDRGHYDDAHDAPFRPDQEVIIPTTEAGTYYILVYGDWVPDAPQAYTILADSVPFSISSVTPDTGSNTSVVTVEIVGARFQDETEFSLITSDDFEIEPQILYPRNQSRAFATFDLAGAAVGPADVKAVNPDESETTGAELFQVVSGGGPQLFARMIVPSRVRAGRSFPVRIEYANIGTADMPAPLFELTSAWLVPMDLDPDGDFAELGSVRFLGVNPDGPAGILPQGAFGVMTVHIFVPDTGYWAHRFLKMGLMHRPAEEWFNWEGEEAYFRPVDADPDEWAQAWSIIQERIGDTWGQFEAEMAQVATRVWQYEDLLVRDPRELFLYEIELAESSFPSRISGTVVDIETGEPLADVLVRGWYDEDGDDSAEVISEVFSDEDGLFELEVSAGQYELYADGYYVDPPVTVSVGANADVRGVTLSVTPVPDDEEPPPPFPDAGDRAPSLTRDADGTVHLAWMRGDEVWHARYTDADWDISGQVDTVEGAGPRIARGPAAEGSDTVTVMWREGSGNEADLNYAVGRPDDTASNGFGWSEPIAATDDVYTDQFPVLLLTATDQLMLVWLKKDSLVEDDTDVYYSFAPIGTITWPDKGAVREEVDYVSLEVVEFSPYATDFDYGFFESGAYFDRGNDICVSGKLGNKSFVRKLPIIGGPYGFEVGGEVCVAVDVCDPSASIQFSGELAFGKKRKFTLSANGSAKWKTNHEKCVYEFDNAKVGVSGSGTIRFPVDTIPAGRLISVIGKWFLIEWDIGVQITGQMGGEAEWKTDFPGWPDRGYLTFAISGGPYGEISFTNYAEAKVNGSLRATAEWQIPGYPRLTGVCIELNAEAKLGWMTWKWKYQYPPNCGGKSLLYEELPPGALVINLAKPARDGEAQEINEIIIVVDPLVGTGTQYPGLTVLPDVSDDLTNDGPPSVALGASGTILATWTKDSGDPDAHMGSSVVVSEFDGVAWSSAVELIDATDFNSSPQVVVDGFDIPMIVWSTASADGITLDNTAEEILAAMADGDLLYSRRIGGVWSAPASLAQLPGGDDDIALAADSTGRVLAAWINTDSTSEQVALYASMWDGSAWSAPRQISTSGAVFSVACEFDSDGTALAVWSADTDGDLVETPEDLTLYHATYDGSWSSPTALPKESEGKRVQPGDTAGQESGRGGDRISLPQPPLFCCCRTDADCDDGFSCTDDKCKDNGECENKKDNEKCDDHQCCNGVETCNPDDSSADENTGCVVPDIEVCEHSPFPCVEEGNDECTCRCEVNAHCDDEDPCTIDECVGEGDGKHCEWKPKCDDGNPCTNDSCDDGDCENKYKCPDGTFCYWYTCDPNGDGSCERHERNCGEDTNCIHYFCVNNQTGGACMSSTNPDCDDHPEPITSNDPNEKIGPAGYGAEGWIPLGENQMYTIMFENKPDASAAAQVVYVTDQLSDNFDWRSFRVGSIGWGDVVVEVPENRSFYQADVAYANSNGYLVRIDAGINIQTGKVSWTLTTIDPATGEIPAEAEAGFLPPNDPETHTGEGFVLFTVRPNRNVATGAVVENLATIVFDINEPIDTNVVSNTIDADPPSSGVDPLPEEVPMSFEVTWSGQDVEGGSGMGTFDIYVSENDGPYALWISTGETSAVYTATHNLGTVRFYSIARDNAGNVEETPNLPDTETLSVDDTIATAWANTPVCEGDTIELHGKPTIGPSGPFTYLWTGPDGFTSDQPAPTIPNATLAMAGAYELTVINGEETEMYTSTEVVVQAAPTAEAGSGQVICAGETVVLSGSGADQSALRWSTSGDGSFNDDTDPNAVYTPGSGDVLAGSVILTLTADGISPCTGSADDTMTVTIQPCVTVNVDVGGLTGGIVDREVTFVTTTCGGTVDTRVQTLTFSPSGRGGAASVTLRGVDAGAQWLSVWEGHTLRTLVSLDLAVTHTDTVDVLLLSGDFHSSAVDQDNYVDITDFAILAASWESPVDPNSGMGGDATGDGYIDAADFAVIQPNFFKNGDGLDGCTRLSAGKESVVGLEPTPTSRTPRTSILVSELSRTVANVNRADLNGDGVIDIADIRKFAGRHHLRLQPQFEAKLRQLEAVAGPDSAVHHSR